jgi:endonuclease III
MKTATKRAEELKSLFKKAAKEHKAPPLQPLEPLVALVKGILSYDVPDERAEAVLEAFNREYTDLNELRVATELELIELAGPKYPAVEARAAMITRSLNAIFEREHTLNLSRLQETRKTETRQFLRDLPDIHPFAEAYTMLFGFGGNAIPIDDTMANYLKEAGIFEPEATLEEVQKFVEHHIKSDDSYAFYAAIRAAALGGTPKKKK